MNKKEFDEVMELHAKWRKGEEGGVRANLRDKILRSQIIRGMDFRGVILKGAILKGTRLHDVIGNRQEIRNILAFDEYPI